jgi:hypothetical protein
VGALGLLVTPAVGSSTVLKRLATVQLWAADNECYARGAAFDLGRYLGWLAELAPFAPRCLFANAPDVVGDAAATWARSRAVLPQLRALGFRPALVAQDGWDGAAVDWAAFDCLFIGGSTAWKESAVAVGVGRAALARGKWVHMGRVNSARRMLIARHAGCGSVDGNKLAFAPDQGLVALRRALGAVRGQRALPLVY